MSFNRTCTNESQEYVEMILETYSVVDTRYSIEFPLNEAKHVFCNGFFSMSPETHQAMYDRRYAFFMGVDGSYSILCYCNDAL